MASSEPMVCAIMLTRDRPQMAARAVRAFRAQTYDRKRLLVYNNNTPGEYDHIPSAGIELGIGASMVPAGVRGLTIGALRNRAMEYADYDIIAHWDDDDLSHPNRLAEQVALLQQSGADCVGYNEGLCWDTRPTSVSHNIDGDEFIDEAEEAWRFAYPTPSYALGGSFCYWHKAWEAHPFDNLHHGEDNRWRLKVKCVGVSSLWANFGQSPIVPHVEPRFIIGVHGGNTSAYNMGGSPASFRRAPEWDKYCEEKMKL